MEVWLEEKKPEVMSTTNVVLALVLHALFFAAVFMFAKIHFKPKETVIPIDLTLVVNENLDGVDNEPPPVNDPPPPEPTPPKPVEPTPPTPTPPPVDTKVDAVIKEPEKKPPEKKPEPPKETQEERMRRMRESVKAPEKKEEKKVEEKKPEPPKKTKAELEKEKFARMRNSATLTKVNIKVPDARSGNGKTDKKTLTDKEIQALLNKGYKPGSTTQIADSEMQFCISRIQQAIDSRWREVMPRIGAEGTVVILVRVNSQGRLVNCRLRNSCGDRISDAAALTVVKTVPAIPGLDREFLKKYAKEDLAIRYKVMAR